MTPNRIAFVSINGRACAAYGIAYGATFPVGAWLVTSDGSAVHVEADGTVSLLPTSLPMSRQSAAAIPTSTRSKP